MKSKKMVTPVSKRKEMKMSSFSRSAKRTKTASFINESSPENQAILKQLEMEEMKKQKFDNVDMWDWKAWKSSLLDLNVD